jgi:hypothetical protein
VYYTSKGEMMYVGRKDLQVKVREHAALTCLQD